jgi:hypothetical protein
MTDQRPLRPIGSVPAFPNDQGLTIADRVGMSKREHFAALFMAGMFANSAISLDTTSDDLAIVAIRSAEALIEKLGEADREDS